MAETTAVDLAKAILAGIIPNRRDRLEAASRKLRSNHFPDRETSFLFECAVRYLERYGSIINKPALESLLRASNADAGRIAHFFELFDLLVSKEVPDDVFLWALDELREKQKERVTGELLAQSMEILNHGAEGERGKKLFGPDDARTHFLSGIADLDSELNMQDAPEGDMREEQAQMLADYADRKTARLSGGFMGVQFGIPGLDAKLDGGLQQGELDLILGYTSAGKSSLLVQLAWNAVVNQGKNVVIATTETLRDQYRRKMLARHSRLPQFGLSEGLNSADLKGGTLPPNLEQSFQDVVADISRNPNYGRLVIAQIPRGATIADVGTMALRWNRHFEVNLLAMDYLQLLTPLRRRDSTREEQSVTVKEAKVMASTFDNGRGVALVSPWQVNRKARDDARTLGRYDLKSTSETAEASNSADIIISTLEPEEITSRHVDLFFQVLKNRDGVRSVSLDVQADFATCYFQSKREAGAGEMDALLGSGADSLMGDSLLT